MTPQDIITAMDELSTRDRHLAEAVKQVGYPAPRNRNPGFGTLMDIIAGQQLSAAAAMSIRRKLHLAVTPFTAAGFLAADPEALRGTGLSQRKVEYGIGLAEAMTEGRLATRTLNRMSDEDAIAEITSIRGLGRWSAEIYLMFALKRTDIWPAEDLAVAEALRRLKALDERPGRAEAEALVAHWRPWRTIGALFMWHYYQGAP